MASMCSFPAAQEVSLEGLRVLTSVLWSQPQHSSCHRKEESSAAQDWWLTTFYAQPVLQLSVTCCRVTVRSKKILRCPYVLSHAAEDIQSYKLH